MKKTAACLSLISLVLLCTETLVQAAEEKIIFNTESIEYKSGTGAKKCQDMCSKRSGPDAKAFLSAGWKIVSSSPKKEIAEQYWYVPCNSCEPHGCTCIGTEYLLQKDQTVVPLGETSHIDRETLKNESDLLKQEIKILKQEIEDLKNQIKSKQLTQ
ncbi:hypothetical protein EG827_09270 [bacterium]|nr:hypothetical protein [bacterium]